MNHPELRIKGATIVGMDRLPELVKDEGADQSSAPKSQPKKSKPNKE